MATACMVAGNGSGLLTDNIRNLDKSQLLSPSNINERFKEYMNNVYPLGYDPQEIKRVPETKFRHNAIKRRKRKMAKASRVKNRR